jgi:hypothetical protein
MGLACALSVTGHLLAPASSLLMIPAGYTCGTDNASAISRWDASASTPAVSYIAWGSTASASVTTDEASATYDFGIPVEANLGPGPEYKICWSHDSLGAADHLVELGVFTLNGPGTASYVCYIGGECTLILQGWGFDPLNKLVIVYGPFDQINGVGSSGAGCGDAYYNPSTQKGVMPASLSYAATTFGKNESIFDIGQAFGPVGKHYSLCWAPLPSSNIPAGLPQFKVTVDRRFELAYPTQDGDKWEEGPQSSGSGGFLGKKQEPETYHDEETGLDLVFQPPATM